VARGEALPARRLQRPGLAGRALSERCRRFDNLPVRDSRIDTTSRRVEDRAIQAGGLKMAEIIFIDVARACVWCIR
jgi:hypothetical protein